MDEQSEARGGSQGAVTARVIGLIVVALIFVPYGMQTKSRDLADLCAGIWLHGIDLALGWFIAIVVALAILLISALLSVHDHSWRAVGTGAFLAAATPGTFAIGVALVSMGGPTCP